MICFRQYKDSNPKLVVHNSFAMLQVDCENLSGETLLADQELHAKSQDMQRAINDSGIEASKGNASLESGFDIEALATLASSSLDSSLLVLCLNLSLLTAPFYL